MSSRPSAGFLEGLLYFLLAFCPFAFGCVEPWSRATLEMLAFLLAAATFLRGRAAASTAGSAGWLFPAGVAVLGCWQVVAAAAADGPRPAWPFTAAIHETESAVLLWAAYACVLYAVPRVVNTADVARRFMNFFFFLGVAVAVLGLAQAATSKDLIYWTRRTMTDVPPFGPYYNRDHAANLLLMSLMAGVGLLWTHAPGLRSVDGLLPGELRTAGRRLAGVLALFGCIAYCNSRGALLALCLASVALALLGSDFAPDAASRRFRLAGSLGALAFVAFCLFAYVHSGSAAGAVMDPSVSGRLTIYNDCLRWLRDSPLFGTGLGSFASVYPSYQDQNLRGIASHAHSDWLEFALETGAFGLAAALATAGAFLFAAFKTWRRAKSREMRALIGGALAAAAAFAFHSLFEFNFQIPANAVVATAVVGFLLAAPAWSDKVARAPRSSAPEMGPSLAALAGFAVACWAAFLPAAAAWSAARVDSPAGRAATLRAAVSLDDDPAFSRDLAREAYGAAVENAEPNPVFLRAGMVYALNASAARPFDPSSLYLMGASLWRLRRFDDANDYFARERQVSFSPLVAARQNGPDWDQRRLQMLKQLDLLPQAGAAQR